MWIGLHYNIFFTIIIETYTPIESKLKKVSKSLIAIIIRRFQVNL